MAQIITLEKRMYIHRGAMHENVQCVNGSGSPVRFSISIKARDVLLFRLFRQVEVAFNMVDILSYFKAESKLALQRRTCGIVS